MHTVARVLSTACLLTMASALHLPALAAEGRIPIPFEPPANPVVINAPGSYVLTRNLFPLAGNPTIQITIPPTGGDIDLDLNGFVVTGQPGGPALSPIVVTVPSGTNSTIRIHDGSIVDGFLSVWGSGPGHFVLERLVARNPTNVALTVGGALSVVIRDCVVDGNPGDGISISAEQATIERNVVRNSARGIVVSQVKACQISENTISEIPIDFGIWLTNATGCKIANNVISRVTGSGVSAGIFIDNTSGRNLLLKNVVTDSGIGIRVAGSLNQIEGNVTNGNGCGLVFSGANNVYRGNTSRGNAGGGALCVNGFGPCGFDLYDTGSSTSAGDNFVPSGAPPCN